ncbi:hypothetical protein [Rhizorhapis sp. SPR117]|uniref:hypothetical protein n=1 Tax=Rhizorhapis sp. SPR117 TaxID=2912611 RepID=UPI001F442C46|nr:hypothetical protein [Rhizorhapis sp. SPR117]
MEQTGLTSVLVETGWRKDESMESKSTKDTQNPDTSGTINQSQQDLPQAQDIAEEALHPTRRTGAETEHGGSPGASVTPLDQQDLVDHMEQMVHSGKIDRSAFRGERNDDDEESGLGSLDPAENDHLGDRDPTNSGNRG